MLLFLGEENMFIFGLRAHEIEEARRTHLPIDERLHDVLKAIWNYEFADERTTNTYRNISPHPNCSQFQPYQCFSLCLPNLNPNPNPMTPCVTVTPQVLCAVAAEDCRGHRLLPRLARLRLLR